MIRLYDSADLEYDDTEEPDVFLSIYPTPRKKQAVLVLEIDETEVADCLYVRNTSGDFEPANKADLNKLLKRIQKQLGLDVDQLKRIATEVSETLTWCVPKNKGVTFEIHFDGEIEPLEL